MPIAGRNRGETEGTLGFFVNTLVLRTRLGGNPSFAALLAQVREAALGAYDNQDLPFERLVAELQPERDLDRTPLFQVFFNDINFSRDPIAVPGLTLTPLTALPPPSKFDLTVYLAEQPDGFHFALHYDAGLFDRERMEEMPRQLRQLLAAALDAPDLSAGIDDLSLLTAEAAAVLPDPMQILPSDTAATVHDLFARQARLSPSQPAVIDRDETWTYGRLDAAANRLAHHLIAAGLAPGDVVAVAAERRASLAWAVLGVLKSGCAFLLLDPEYPEARRAAMLRLGGARALVRLPGADLDDELMATITVDGETASRLVEGSWLGLPGEATGCLQDPKERDGQSEPGTVAGIGADPAYVAFTSGSTGEPKAILGTHAPLTHFFAWQAATFDLSTADRFSLLSGLSHDPLLRDLLAPLLLGATLAVPPRASLDDPQRLGAWLAEERVTVLHLTPALGRLLAQGDPHLPALRYAFFGGDRLTAADVARLRRMAPAARVVNFYGATETPQAMGWLKVSDVPDEAPATVPLGAGIDGVQLLVRNGHGGWAGIGELGEIVIRTPYLTRGYLGDDELTRERFLADPQGGTARLYRTGDLGRHRPDGTVEFAGRADRQIKIRGFRIEPAEIEAALTAEPEIAEAVVLAVGRDDSATGRDDSAAGRSDSSRGRSDSAHGRSDAAHGPQDSASGRSDPAPGSQHAALGRGDSARGRDDSPPRRDGSALGRNGSARARDGSLAAFVVLRQGATVGEEELRRRLALRLPSAMIPAAILRVDPLPLTPNRKVDRRALLALLEDAQSDPVRAAADGAPRDPIEEVVAGIWEEVLGRGGIRIHDSFFALGGHSLLATQVLSRLRHIFAVELPLRRLFETPTVAGLAQAIAALRAAEAGASHGTAPPLVPLPREQPAPLSFAQESLWIFEQLSPGTATYNMPVALRLRGPARVDALAAALAEIARRQGSLRTTFAEVPGAGPVQVIAPAQDVWAEGSSPLGGGGLEQGGGQEGGIASDRDLPRSEALPERGAPLLTSPLSQPPPSQGGGKRAASGKRAPLPLIDLSALPPERREATAHGLAAAEARRPFELTRGPLWRTRLLRLDGEDHVLLLTTHHILCDGWSMGVLAAELGALYEAYAAGRPSPLPELTVQYADYAAWQRAWLSGAALDAQLDFWRARLHGVPALLELPTDRPRTAERAHRGARLFWQLPEATAAALSAIARRGGATPFMLLLAAFEAVLARHSGQEDLVVGLSIAHRNRVEIEPLVGFFVNMLALRADLGGDPTFERLLEQARATTLEALDHQDLPFERLVAELRPERGLAHSPLFQVLCTLVNVPLAPRLAGLRLEPFATGGQTAHFDLTLSLATGGERWIAGYLEYDTGLFDATTALRLLGHFETLLAAVAEAPGRPLSELPLLGEGERQQLREWNDTAAVFPRDLCVHERIADQARRTPEALAVAAGDERLTFAALEDAAESLATHLRTLGVGPDSVVALYLERSAALAIAVLAVWKAGGAFLPLDLADPRERLAWVLQDASPSLLLTRSGLQPRLPKQRGGEGVRVVLLDTPEKRPHPRPLSHLPPTPPPGEGRQEEAEKGREEDLAFPPSPGERGVGDGRGAGGEGAFPEASGALPDHLAYIIYTSGSTGRPKGTMIPHRGVMNYLSWAVAAYRVEEGCGAPVHTPLAFDLTVTSLLAPWLAGRCAVLVSEEEGVAGLGLALAEPDAVTAAGFSLVKLTPAHLPLLAEQPGAVASGRTRALVIGGEALNGERLAPWRRAAPDTRVINEYGPTETVVGCCVYAAPAGALGEGPVPIGRPIANAGLYVVDRGLQPVPLGTPGELLIGGAGLARGYLRRPDLTAERFVPDALSGEPGARLYRTGDRVRQHPDGLLEVVGRLDDQVKIRGFRIELGEVEAALASHSSLAAAAVAAWPGPSGKRLVAYVVPHPEEEAASVGELRRHLRARLPEHMQPAAFVTLPALPLTINGKVDRRSLPAPPEEEPPPPAPEAVAAAPAAAAPDSGEPRTEVEKALAEIWAQLLRLPRVGVHDNFFELGGDSILSLQMASRARAAGLRLKSRDVFQHQTVAQLATVVQVLPATEPSAAAAPASQEAVPLTPIQRWFFELGHAEPAHYNQSLLLLLRRPTPPAILAAAAAHLVVHHEALRLRFEPRQRIAPPEPWAPFTAVDLSRLAAPAEAIEAASAALQGSLDLAAGPLLRLAHFDLGPGAPGRLLVIIHHLAVDGVSWRILLEDLETACAALERGEPVRLPEPPTPFRRWAERLQDLARSPELAAELPYWQAEERTRIAPLPLDVPAAPAVDLRHATRYVTASLDETETEALLRRVPADLESRIEELLLAAVALACRRWTGSPALLVDLEGHGREAFGEEEGLDLSRTVGWLTTIAPVLLDLSDVPPETGARGAVPAVRRQLRAMPRRGAGFGVLRYPATENEEARRLADRPAAPLLFNYFGQLDAALPVDSRLSAAPESAGPHVSPRNRRSHPLQIDAAVSGGRLSFTWSYSAELHRAETIERLAAGCLDELRRLAVPRDAAPAEIAETYPLTPMQQGILFHSRLAAGPAENAELYVAQYDMTLRGALDLPAFRGAWQGVIDRHAVLRTGFQWEGLDRPQQEVRRSVAAPLTVLDWSGVAEEERAARLAELLRADRRRGFDPRTAPLLRVALIRLGEDEHRMVFSFHHLLLDGWSMPLLFGELLHLYEALRRGARPELPPVRPFRDYVEWLAQLNTADREETEAFWRRELAGFTAPTPVPLEALAVPGSAADYTRRHHLLTTAETAALQRLARRGRVTLGTLAQGAWALLLAHHSGTGDVLFGATSSGRPPELEGAESMLGLFIATLPVRAGVDPAAPLLPWLEALQQRLARLRELEHCPLTEIQSWSELPRGTPLFHSLVIFENYPADPGAGASTTGLRLGGAQALQNTNYPLNFVAALRDDRLLLRLAFDAGRHRAPPVERALSHLAVLLRALGEAGLDGDGTALGALPFLNPAERHQLLHEWSGSVGDKDDPPLHHLFERTAAAAPKATALIFEDQSLSYSEVDARTSRLAADLRRQGIGPETLVALALPRSPWLPIAMLAVWKAGGAFLPIDPSYPQERRDFMLSDSGAALLLTEEDVQIGASLFSPLPRPETGASLAYVIYTSGSTGAPKGVMIEHRGLANLVREQIAAFCITAESRVLQLASASFDASVSEIWTAWVAGAALVMLPEGAVAADEGLVRRLREQAVSVATFPPSLLAALPPAELPALATLVVAGEAANAALLARWASGRERVLNAYGPTEITVCATIERWDPETGDEPLLGRPIANTRVRLLSLLDESEPAAIGAVGEIGLSGIGLARGYLGRPERTAASFVPDPWSESPGGRLYRTGDLARWTGDGRLAYLGRRDGQVKVRGFRIETGEVEAALARHPEVQTCAVAARRDQLVAYVVPAGPGGTALAGRLRAFLQGTLPEALVPGRFVELPALPCTPSGKLDRRALPDPEAVVRERSAPPRTDLERYLAGVWSEILGVQEIGIDDDFFQLGGHSLSGATVVGRLQKDLGEIVHVVVMYDAPTVGRLAVYLTAHYPEAVARLLGTAPVSGPAPAEEPPVTEEDLAELRRIVAEGRTDRGPRVIRPRNPPALFVLSAPRSGSTLLRVMLAGHPLMFAPPELELLSFETLAERRAAFAGRNSFWLEGAVRALMEIQRCDADQAEATVAALEAEGATPQDLYRRMQEQIVPRLLIDKTPSYALDPEVLARAERWFDGARYLHLVRHPTAMIRSFEEARLDQVFFRFPHRFSRRRLAELIWSVSEANIQAFLAGVEPERHYLLRYEELVADPEAELRRLCGWLEIDFHPAMAQPYENRESRMTDGIHPWSRMLGDVKFHEHRAVDPAAADRWRAEMQGHVLGGPTLDLAEHLGYAAPSRLPWPPAMVPLKASGSRPPLVCIHPAGGDVLCYRDLAQALDGERPVYGLQAHGVAAGEAPLTRMEEIAERSLTVLRAAFPSGPYHLLGWSFGGLVAYEIARRLTAAGEEVALLAVLDAGPKPKAEAGEERPHLDAADLLADEFRAVLAVTAEEIRALPEGERLPWLFARAEAVGKLPAGLDPAYVERLLATFQAHQQAALAYRPRPYPGRLTLFRAVGDLASRPDLAMGWNGLAADLEIVKVPGGHEDMVAPPHLETLAVKLRELLARGETR
jgi:amino acid adenylation domain-containing protein/non-ribosomal peptide synthase protein (TIGR01720 family)